MAMMKKECGKCNEVKPLPAFNRQNRSPDGFATICRACINERERERYRFDPSKQRRASERWAAKNPERAAQSNRKAALDYKHRNLGSVRERAREVDARRYKENREKRITVTQKARAKRRQNPLYRKYEHLCAAISRAIKSPSYEGRASTWTPLGYTPDQLRTHLERNFEPGMNWSNYGHGDGLWELDHFQPIASLDPVSSDILALRRVFALRNLRPTWTKDNMRKSSLWQREHWTLKSHD